MMLLSGKRKKILSQEWRIWPFLTACTGTQLAFAVLHMVVKDSFACVLTVFSFIGSLCCIISRRFEVVLANVLLQVVAFFTLFICCCLGTSSMQMWHEDKKLVPLIVTHILFFAALLILNGSLLALKRRHRQHDPTERNSVFGNWKKPFGGKTQSSASAYAKSSKCSRTSDRVQRQREEQQHEPAQNQQMHSCCTHVSACVEKPCMAGVNLLPTSSAHGIARQGPPSGYVKELSGTYQEPSNPLFEDESEDGETFNAVTMGRRANPQVCEREWVSPHFVIRSHRIEAAGGSQRYSAPTTRTTSQAFAAKLGRSSCSSATPPICRQSLALHGRTPRSVPPGDALASDRGRRTSQGPDVPAAACSPAAELTPVATAGGVGVFLVNDKRAKNATNLPTALCASSPQRCSSGHYHDKGAPCSCPMQIRRACPFSSTSSLHSCIALSDEGTGCEADTLTQNDVSYRPPSTGAHKYFSAVNLTKSVRRCWETTLNYLSQTVDCETVTNTTEEKAQKLHHSDTPADATPSPTTEGGASANVHRSIQRLRGDVPSGDRSLGRGRRTSVDNSCSPETLDGSCGTYTDLKDKRKDAGLEDRGEETREQTSSGLSAKQELATAQNPVQNNKQTRAGGVHSPAVPLDTTEQPAEAMQNNKNRDSCIDPATRTREGFIPTASETGEQREGHKEVGGHLWVAEVHTESAQEILAKQNGHKQEEGAYHSGSATPTNSLAAAKPNAAPVSSSRELGSERSCPLVEGMPEEMQLGDGNTCDGVGGTTGKQRRLPVVVPEKREQVLGYTEQSVSAEVSALSGDRLALRSRSVEVLVNAVETAPVMEATKPDMPCNTSQLDHTDKRSAECEAVNNHRVPEAAFLKGIKSTFEGTTTPFKAGDALPLSGSFERLPGGTVAVGEDITSLHTLFNQAGAEDCQMCNSKTNATPCSQFPLLNCSSGADGRVGGPFPASETLAGNGISSTDWKTERVSGELFLGSEAEHDSGTSQSDPSASQCAPAAGVSATPAGEEMHKGSCVCNSEGEKSSFEVTARRDVIIRRASSEHVEFGKTVGTSCVTTDVHRVNARTAAEATSRTGSKLPSRSTRSGGNTEEVRCSVHLNAVNLPTTVATNINNVPLAVPMPLGGSAVSKEKVVYTDNLARELTLNTTPRAEDDEDSWEDESEETEGQIQDDVIARKDSERESRSEWELSDLSDAATLSEKRQQGQGTQRNQKSKGNSSAESSAAFGKYSTKKKRRNCRRSR